MDDDEKIQGESERITVYVVCDHLRFDLLSFYIFFSFFFGGKVQGRNLPNYDINGHSDPYVKVKFGHLKNSSFRTTFVRKELNPVWNGMNVHLSLYRKSSTVLFTVLFVVWPC